MIAFYDRDADELKTLEDTKENRELIEAHLREVGTKQKKWPATEKLETLLTDAEQYTLINCTGVVISSLGW